MRESSYWLPFPDSLLLCWRSCSFVQPLRLWSILVLVFIVKLWPGTPWRQGHTSPWFVVVGFLLDYFSCDNLISGWDRRNRASGQSKGGSSSVGGSVGYVEWLAERLEFFQEMGVGIRLFWVFSCHCWRWWSRKQTRRGWCYSRWWWWYWKYMMQRVGMNEKIRSSEGWKVLRWRNCHKMILNLSIVGSFWARKL